MGLWNTHGLDNDEERVQAAIGILGLTAPELEALAEYARREQYVWSELAKHRRGQKKRRANMIAKHFGLRLAKWIDLAVQAEVEYEEEYGAFADPGEGA